MTVRRGPLAVGLVALAAAVVLTVREGLLAGVPSTAVAVVVVVLAAAVGVVDLLGRSTDGPTSDPLVEDDVRIPGDRIDDRLRAVAADETERGALRNRLETVAVDVLVRQTGCSPAEARRRLADGEWTDDELARSLFDDSAADPGTRDHLRALATGRTRFERSVERAVDRLLERDR